LRIADCGLMPVRWRFSLQGVRGRARIWTDLRLKITCELRIADCGLRINARALEVLPSGSQRARVDTDGFEVNKILSWKINYGLRIKHSW
jgi:hypothetical protein